MDGAWGGWRGVRGYPESPGRRSANCPGSLHSFIVKQLVLTLNKARLLDIDPSLHLREGRVLYGNARKKYVKGTYLGAQVLFTWVQTIHSFLHLPCSTDSSRTALLHNCQLHIIASILNTPIREDLTRENVLQLYLQDGMQTLVRGTMAAWGLEPGLQELDGSKGMIATYMRRGG